MMGIIINILLVLAVIFGAVACASIVGDYRKVRRHHRLRRKFGSYDDHDEHEDVDR